MVEALFGRDFGNVDQAFDAFGHGDERAELGDGGHLAFDLGAGVQRLHRLGPGVAESLL